VRVENNKIYQNQIKAFLDFEASVNKEEKRLIEE
jgi:hypothetical protein